MACQFENLCEEAIAENLLFIFTKGPNGDFINIRQTFRNKEGNPIYLKAGLTFSSAHVKEILLMIHASKANQGKKIWNTTASDGTLYNLIMLDPCYKLFSVKKHHRIATSIYMLNEEWDHIIKLLEHLHQ